MEDNTIQMKKDLEMFMYQLRIEAEVHVLEMVSPNYQADQVYTNFVSWPAYNVLNQIVKDFFLLLYLKTILSNKYVFIWKSNICDTFEKKGKNQLFKICYVHYSDNVSILQQKLVYLLLLSDLRKKQHFVLLTE